MREILFRGKAINRIEGYEYRTNYQNGDWVYGLLTKLYCERYPELPAEITNKGGISGIYVDYTTVGQYTGLTDKNSVKIFEGDIVRQYSEGIDNEYLYDYYDIGQVFWYQSQTRFLRTSNLYLDDCPAMREHCEYEVIGNIHDNPELLKGAEI